MGTGLKDIQWRLISSAPVFFSVMLLLANDWYFKAAYHNWLTGKLSDFAGIFLLAVLAFALLPRWKAAVSISIGLTFAVWKSPLSEPAISFVNEFGPAGFGRVVDRTDLIALMMVPVAWAVASRIEGRPIRFETLRRAVALPVLAFCSLSMVATTYATYGTKFEMEQGEAEVLPERMETAKAIEKVANRFRLRCVQCEDIARSGFYQGKKASLEYVILADNSVRVWIRSKKKRRPRFVADKLKEALQRLEGKVTFYDGDYTSGVNNIRLLGTGARGDLEHAQRVADVFSRFAEEHAFARFSSGDYWRNENAEYLYLDIVYGFEDDDTLFFEVSGNRKEEIPVLCEELTQALSDAYSDVEFYSIEETHRRSVVFVDLRKARPRSAQD